MNWLKDAFGAEKVVIASLYLPPLPGSPDFRPGTPLKDLIAVTRREVETLDAGRMDAIVFGNQQDRPWKVGVGPETTAMMTRIILEATQGFSIPFGITVFWDDLAAIAVAKATGACFVRGVFRGTYAGEMGLLTMNAADALRYRAAIDATDIKLMFLLRPILCQLITPRNLESQVKDALWSSKPDAFTLGGPIPGQAPAFDELRMVKKLAKDVPVFMNNGGNTQNLAQVFASADGLVIGTHLREDNVSWKPFDRQKVAEFMELAEQYR
jgi:membrane complex biogenesis BtpA family protein